MQRWPKYGIEDLPKLTPAQQLWLLETGARAARSDWDQLSEAERWLTTIR